MDSLDEFLDELNEACLKIDNYECGLPLEMNGYNKEDSDVIRKMVISFLEEHGGKL